MEDYRGGLLRVNYSGNKRRKEEARKKKQEDKRMKRLNKPKEEETPTSFSNRFLFYLFAGPGPCIPFFAAVPRGLPRHGAGEVI